MSKYEITWDVYEVWSADIDIIRRQVLGVDATERDKFADPLTISQPTKPYTDMTFGMGKRGLPGDLDDPALRPRFCQWLQPRPAATIACRPKPNGNTPAGPGRTTAYSFGDDPGQARTITPGTMATATKSTRRSVRRSPIPGACTTCTATSPSGCSTQNEKGFYQKCAEQKLVKNPLAIPTREYDRVVRGGSWDDKPEKLRSAARRYSDEGWKEQDPQEPQSIWYLTDAKFLGLRVIRPLREPSAEEKAAKWDKNDPPQLDREEREKVVE